MAKDAKTRAKAKVMWERGDSSRDIAEAVGVSDHHTILDWAEKGEWVKGRITPKLAQKEEEGALEAAHKLGLTREYFLDKVKTLCEATKPVLVKGSPKEEAEAKEEGDESGGAFVQEIPDYRAISDGLTHAERMIPGIKIPDKLDLTSGGRSLLDEVLDET